MYDNIPIGVLWVMTLVYSGRRLPTKLGGLVPESSEEK
jgi:hypothetical protein